MRFISSSTLVALVASLLCTSLLAELVEFVNVECDPDVREASKCYAGGVFNNDVLFTGTFVCGRRNAGGLPGFAWTTPSTICVGTVLGQVIGYAGDTCGCCDGECPKLCSCICDDVEDKVLVFRQGALFGESTECISRGIASREIGRSSEQISCVPDDQCASYLSPGNSTSAFNGTEYEQTEVPEAEVDLEGTPELEAEEPEEETTATEVGPARERPAGPNRTDVPARDTVPTKPNGTAATAKGAPKE
jgi:hypothetical protein